MLTLGSRCQRARGALPLQVGWCHENRLEEDARSPRGFYTQAEFGVRPRDKTVQFTLWLYVYLCPPRSHARHQVYRRAGASTPS